MPESLASCGWGIPGAPIETIMVHCHRGPSSSFPLAGMRWTVASSMTTEEATVSTLIQDHHFMARRNRRRPSEQHATKTNKTTTAARSAQQQQQPSARKVAARAAGQALRAIAPIIGGYYGGPPGAALATQLMEHQTRAWGSGAYVVGDKPEVNTLLPMGTELGLHFRDAPSTGLKRIRVCAEEPIGSIRTGPVAGAFNVMTLDVQPANRMLFTLLSQFAALYSEYRLMAMVVTFKTNASRYAGSGAIGDLIMAHNCNPLMPAPTSALGMMQMENSVQCSLADSCMMGVECADFVTKRLFVDSAGVAGMPRTARDAGRLFIATNPAASFATNAVVGVAHVAYEIEFDGLRMDARPEGVLHIERTGSALATPFGTADARPPVAQGAFGGAVITSTSISMPNLVAGDVIRMTVYIDSAGAVSVQAPSPTLTGLALTNVVALNGANARVSPVNGVSSAVWYGEYYLTVTGDVGQPKTFGFPTAGPVLPSGGVLIWGAVIGNSLSPVDL